MDQIMDRVHDVERFLAVAPTIVGVLTVVLLGVVVARRARALLAAAPTAVRGRALVTTLGIVLLALLIGALLGIPAVLAPVVALELVLVVLLRLDDARWWRAALAGLVTFSVLGLLLILATAVDTRLTSGPGGFYGLGRIIHAAGPHANPASWWSWIVLPAFAVLQYGMPWGAGLSLAWIVGTRSDLGRLERTALTLTLAGLYGSTLEGPGYTLLYVVSGPRWGMSWAVFALALPVAIVTFMLIGPGGLDGLVTGWRAVIGHVRAVDTALGLSASLKDVAGALTGEKAAHGLDDRPFGLFVAQSVRRGTPRLRLFASLIVIVGLLYAVGEHYRPSGGTMRVTMSGWDDQISLGEVVDDTAVLPGSSTVWAHTSRDTVLAVNLRTHRVRTVATAVSDITVAEGHVLGLVVAGTSRVVALDGASPRPVVTLASKVSGALAVQGGRVLVGGLDGSLSSFDRRGGALLRAVRTGEAIAEIMVRGQDIWTLHTPRSPNVADGRYRGQRRDVSTLARVREQPPVLLLNDLAIPPTGSSWFVQGRNSGQYALNEDSLEQTSSLRAVDGDGRLAPGRDARSAWVMLPMGHLEHLTAAGSQRVDLPVDNVTDVLETDEGTWVVGNWGTTADPTVTVAGPALLLRADIT